MSSRASYDARSAPAKLCAYPRWARVSVAALGAVASLNLLLLGAAVLLANDPPVTPPLLLRDFALFTAAPALAAALLSRGLTAEVTTRGPDLVVERRSQRIEIPLASIERVRGWRCPLPQPGFALELRSGRRFPYSVASRDPTPLLRELERAGVRGAAEACTGAVARWAEARAAVASPGSSQRLLEFPGFALLPTALLFNVHQQIAYGGILGEYYLLGLRSYLVTLATYWGVTTVYLLIFATFLRAIAELACLGVTRAAPSRAERARRGAELACGVGYYAGVPLALLLRFLP